MATRVLAVSPRFAPTNGADTHRLRLLLAHAEAAGWSVEVLAVDAADVVGPVDPWLSQRVPTSVQVHRVRAGRPRGWGWNGLAQRSFVALYRKGCELLASGRFDLVFFSTTEFPLHTLGPLWRRKFGVPFCMDFQDPWVNDYYRLHPHIVPPGGRLKYAMANRVHRLMEGAVVRRCSGFLSVSNAYLEDLATRHGAAMREKPWLVRPFPAEPDELQALATDDDGRNVSANSGVWRYIGRGGGDMAKAARAFFSAWTGALESGAMQAGDARFEAIGTSYAGGGRGQPSFAPLVEGTTLATRVTEDPERLGYADMLRTLMRSDALVVFGSDDPAYTASKIYPYLLAGKPLLAIFHRRSSVVNLMQDVGGGVCVCFDETTTPEALAEDITNAWFRSRAWTTPVPLDRERFEPYTASAQAQDLRRWFDEVLACSAQQQRHP